MTGIDRASVIEAVRERLRDDVLALERMHHATADEVGSDETRQEGKYDTRSTEASYLARGQAMRLVELLRLRAWFEALHGPTPDGGIDLGSLVHLEGKGSRLVFVAPDAGPTVEVQGARVAVVSLSSPLGQAIAGACEGDEVEVDGPQGLTTYRVLALL